MAHQSSTLLPFIGRGRPYIPPSPFTAEIKVAGLELGAAWKELVWGKGRCEVRETLGVLPQ